MKTNPKRSFLLTLLIFVGISVSAQKPSKHSTSPKLHVIYMLEQEDPTIGLLNLRNDELMSEITKTVEWGLGYPMQLTYLSKKDFTQAALQRTITDLKTLPNDIIILYYSGFGVMSTKNTVNFAGWKLHDTPVQGLAVSEVEKWLLAKNVHLRLLIADCTTQLLTNNEMFILPMTSGQDLRKLVIQRLFLNTCGLVKMGSSLPMVPSWTAMNGGASAFTRSLNNAFQELLLTKTSAELARISFEYLTTVTERELQTVLGNKPFKQAPVLELKSCRNGTQPIVRRAMIDPLAAETLNSLFNAVAFSMDSLQSTPMREQLLGLSQAGATVEVSRYFLPGYNWQNAARPAVFPPDTSSTWQEDVKFHKTYSLKAYLDQIQKPISYVEADTLRTLPGRYRKIFVTKTEVDKSVSKPLKHLTIRENWK